MATAPYPMPTFSYGPRPENMKSPGKISTAGVPGFDALSADATGIISSLMGGLPSAAPAQRQAAYFGVGSGMPGSDFARNRGFDLYGEQADQYQQRGFDNFLKLLQGYSGTVMPTAGQQIQNDQFNAQLAFEDQQAQAQQSLDQQALNMRKPKAQENSFSTYNTFGSRRDFRPGPLTYR